MRYGRVAKGQGKDMGGSQMRSRFDAIEADRLAAKKAAEAAASTRTKGAEPTKDPRVGGSGVAFNPIGVRGVPTIYVEKEGGRRGGRGKRLEE